MHFIYIPVIFVLGYMARPYIEDQIKEVMRNLHGK